MKEIETLKVRVTYEVDLGFDDIPEDVFKALQNMEGEPLYDSMAITEDPESDEGKAWAFLSDNFRERDAHSFEYEIEEILEKE